MNPMRTVLMSILAALVILAAGGAVGYWLYMGANYVSTDNAYVNLPMVPVSAPAAGTVTKVEVAVGQSVAAGQTLVRLQPAMASAAAPVAPRPASRRGRRSPSGGAAGTPAPAPAAVITVSAPVDAVVAQVSVTAGTLVGPGTPLVTLAEPSQATVVANVPETEIRNVHAGQSVTITIDAYPGTTFSGTVQSVAPATQASLSLFPASALSGTFTKVTQLVPVTISLQSQGYRLFDGEDAEVTIKTGSGTSL